MHLITARFYEGSRTTLIPLTWVGFQAIMRVKLVSALGHWLASVREFMQFGRSPVASPSWDSTCFLFIWRTFATIAPKLSRTTFIRTPQSRIYTDQKEERCIRTKRSVLVVWYYSQEATRIEKCVRFPLESNGLVDQMIGAEKGSEKISEFWESCDPVSMMAA